MIINLFPPLRSVQGQVRDKIMTQWSLEVVQIGTNGVKSNKKTRDKLKDLFFVFLVPFGLRDCETFTREAVPCRIIK